MLVKGPLLLPAGNFCSLDFGRFSCLLERWATFFECGRAPSVSPPKATAGFGRSKRAGGPFGWEINQGYLRGDCTFRLLFGSLVILKGVFFLPI